MLIKNLAVQYQSGNRKRGGQVSFNSSSTSVTAEAVMLVGSGTGHTCAAGSKSEMVDIVLSQSQSSYEGVRSALMYLHKRAGVIPSPVLKANMAQFIAGCKRMIQMEKEDLLKNH